MSKRKTSRGAWIFVIVIIAISFASAAYSQHQRDTVKQEILEKYQTAE